MPLLGQEIRFENGQFMVPGSSEPGDFSVYAGSGDVPPVMGTYSQEGGSLVFRPRFALTPGLIVRAVLKLPGKPPVESTFKIPASNIAASTRVQQVYPSINVIPVNQLKFYIEFSAPMQRGEAWRRIHLLDDKETPVELPFLEIDQELWDRETKRLTVLFDPGRIKRGLDSLAEAGPALEEARSYTLAVDREWRDASGAPLQQGFRKAFRAGPPDRTPLDPANWQITAPAAHTSEPVAIQFPEPLDYALLLRLIRVENVQGSVSAGSNETEWRFVPREPWRPGDYRVIIDTALEDLAGNRIGRAFDVDTFERVTRKVERTTISLPFRVGLDKR